jgi:hypothetical protein
MSMKLYGSDNSELMDVSKIYRRENELVMEGTIMEAMPIVARLKPAEIRQALKLLSLGDLLFIVSMLFRISR